MFLAEKGIGIPFAPVDIMKRENRTPEFVEKINAMGGVPVLELDDGSHIAESVAICRYLEALHPAPALFGTSPKEIGTIEMWLRRIELNFMVPVGMVWIHGSPLTKAVMKNQIEAVADQNRELVARYFGFLDRQLESRDFIAGDAFTMADIVAFTTLEFGASLNELHPAPEHTNLTAWRERVGARDSAKA